MQGFVNGFESNQNLLKIFWTAKLDFCQYIRKGRHG